MTTAGIIHKGAGMQSDMRWYVYVFFDLSGSPRYVGKGCGDRWRRHFKRTDNPRLRKLIERLGDSIPVSIVRSNLSDEDAIAMEIALIGAIGRGRKGPLYNLTDGGEGASGYKWSDDAVDRRKKYWSSDASADERVRMSVRAKIQMSDPSEKEKVRQRSLGNKYGSGRKMSDSTKKALSSAVKISNAKREASEATRNKRSENFKRLWAERREQMIASQKESRNGP